MRERAGIYTNRRFYRFIWETVLMDMVNKKGGLVTDTKLNGKDVGYTERVISHFVLIPPSL